MCDLGVAHPEGNSQIGSGRFIAVESGTRGASRVRGETGLTSRRQKRGRAGWAGFGFGYSPTAQGLPLLKRLTHVDAFSMRQPVTQRRCNRQAKHIGRLLRDDLEREQQ